MTAKQTAALEMIRNAGAAGVQNRDITTGVRTFAPAVIAPLIKSGAVEVFQDGRLSGSAVRYRVPAR